MVTAPAPSPRPQPVAGLPAKRPQQSVKALYFPVLFASAAMANFFNLHLEDLGFTGSQIGTVASSSAAAGLIGQILLGRLPFYWLADRIERRVGARGLFLIASVCYGLRMTKSTAEPRPKLVQTPVPNWVK